MQLNLDIHHELIIDNFAGGGGASTGIELALGRRVDVAIDHDPEAVAMHTANHPETRHYCESVWEVNPREVTQGRPVGLVWLSPDCKHFSKAKGGKPVEKKIRGLAWVALRWAATVRPRVIMLENVEEFVTWGPLVEGADGKMRPCPKRRGREFNAFRNALQRHGYQVEHRELRASDYGAPTIRKRLFLIARRDGLPIVWPEPTHGDPKGAAVKAKQLKPWRTAAECIDWTLPAPSIFERQRPLAEATCRRIAKGIMRYVVNAAEPFVVPLTHHGAPRRHDLGSPLPTVTAAHRGELALVAPHVTKFRANSIGSGCNEPLHTVTAGGESVRPAGAAHAMGLVQATLAPILTEHANASSPRCNRADEPLRTICAQTKGGHHALIAPTLIQTGYGEREGQSPRVPGLDKPLGTVVAGGAKHALVAAFMAKHYGVDQDPRLEEPLHTVTTKDRFGLVTVAGEQYAIADIGMRMLAPRELYRAQGFPDTYVIGDDPAQGLKLSKSAQVRMCGNSVCPPLSAALVRANLGELAVRKTA